jgi:hypothetical protein
MLRRGNSCLDNPGRFCRSRSAEHVWARVISLLALQITAEPSLLWFRSDHRKSPDALHAAQSLHLYGDLDGERAASMVARGESNVPE